MLDQPLSRDQQQADLERAPAAAPATAKIVTDSPRAGAKSDGQGDQPESPPPPDAPEINPDPLPETNPDLQPDIPPVENPSIQND